MENLNSNTEQKRKISDRYKLLKICKNSNIFINELLQDEYTGQGSFYKVSKKGYITRITLKNISKIPDGLFELNSLEFLDISNNCITEMPLQLLRFKGKISIDLSNTLIQEIPEEILESKFELDAGFKRVTGKKVIILSNCPIKYPPIEIVSSGKSAILNFLNEKKLGIDYLYELKVLITGEGRVGKTALLKSLLDVNYVLEDELSTEGIRIAVLHILREEFLEIVNEQVYKTLIKDFTINFWDFGGQELYHSTHQFFLTRRSIYLLVTESRKEDKPEDFFYWLNIISILGDNSPVILVLNKCDQPTKDIPINEYKKIFPNIIGSVEKISCKYEYKNTIVTLKDTLKRVISDKNILPHIGSPLPKVWVEIRRDLENEKSKGRNFIYLNEYFKICDQRFSLHKVMNPDDTRSIEERSMSLSDYLHDIGVILHFKDDFWLKEIVFLNNEWLTKAVYKILDHKIVKENKGRFDENDVSMIWSDSEYEKTRKELLALMKNRRFDICFEYEQGKFLAPQLFDIDRPIVDELRSFEKKASDDSLTYFYSYNFKPKGILSRFIVKNNLYILNRISWRYGVLLHYADCRALITEPPLENIIRIEIIGTNKQSLADKISETIDLIHSDFSNLKFKRMIPCICSSCSSRDPIFYNDEELYKRLYSGKLTIECPSSYINVNVLSIITSFTNTKRYNFEYLNPTYYSKVFRIFISYSHKDTIWLVKLQKHLKVLEKLGITIDIWSDQNIEAGMSWKEEIERSISQSNVAILLISTEFLISDFISDNELPPLLLQASNNKTEIIPVIIEDSLFSEFKELSKYQAINSITEPLIELTKNKQNKIFLKLVKRIKELYKQQDSTI